MIRGDTVIRGDELGVTVGDESGNGACEDGGCFFSSGESGACDDDGCFSGSGECCAGGRDRACDDESGIAILIIPNVSSSSMSTPKSRK